MGKKQPQYPRCVDCGRHAGIVTSSTGRICRSCQDKRNERLDEFAANGHIVAQPIDPDDRAHPCGNSGCRLDATTVLRFRQTTLASGTVHMFACNSHVADATMAAWQVVGGDLSSVGRIEEN